MVAVTADTVKLGIIDEVTPGITPTNPAFKLIRATGESLAFAPTITESAELTPGRGVADSALTGGQSAGDINFELSHNAAFERMLAGVMCSEWGDLLGFTTGQMPVGWDTNWIALGQQIKTFSYIKEWAIAGTIAAQVFPEVLFNTLQMTITPGSIISGAFGTIAGTVQTRTGEFTGQTFVSAGIDPVFTAPKVSQLEFRSTNLTTPLGIGLGINCFNNMVINLNNNIRGRECIGFLGPQEFALGKANSTIAATIYFSNNDMLDMLIDQDEFSLFVTVADSGVSPNKHSYQLIFPRCKMTAAPILAGGTGQDVVVDAEIAVLTPAAIPYSPIRIHRITA